MKLKRIVTSFLSCVLAGALLTGCGESGQQLVDKPGNNFSGNEVQLGMLAPLNSNEQSMGDILTRIEEAAGIKDRVPRPKFYDNLKTMQMGIESGQIQEISLYKCVADYIIAGNSKYEIVSDPALEKIAYSFCFAVRKSDVELQAELDNAIDSMKADGTLDKLINEYITDVKPDNIPAVEIPKIDDVPTLKVGVTGDLPPLDLILPDGQPAGFNTALLAAVSEKIGTNFELIDVDSGARAVALTSKQVDVIFWVAVPQNSTLAPPDCYTPPGVILTNPYFTDEIVHVEMTK